MVMNEYTIVAVDALGGTHSFNCNNEHYARRFAYEWKYVNAKVKILKDVSELTDLFVVVLQRH